MSKRGHRGAATCTRLLPAWAQAVLRLIAGAGLAGLRNIQRELRHLLRICDERIQDLQDAAHESHEGQGQGSEGSPPAGASRETFRPGQAW